MRHKRPRIEWFHLCKISRRGKSTYTESRPVWCKGLRWEEECGVTACLMGMRLPFEAMKIFWNLILVVAAHVVNSRCYWIEHCKVVNFVMWIPPQSLKKIMMIVFSTNPMNNSSRVKVLDSTQHLIEKVWHPFMI